jgi:hypothetical protein
VSLAFTLLCFGEPEFRLPILAFKFLAARSPDAEIAFPAGTELILRLARDVQLHDPATGEPAIESLTASQSTQLQKMFAMLPEQQTIGANKQPSDLINIVLIGSKPAIERAFRAAGWNGTERHGVMALYHMYHCVAERIGYSMAPMTTLKLNGSPPEAAFQKGLNTFAKRHHIRFWHEEQSGFWLGAATEDVKFQVRGMRITHDTDPNIDNERAKVVNDLAFTGCIDRGALIPRPNPIREQTHSIVTDGDIAVLQVNGCVDPLVTPSTPHTPTRTRATGVTLAVTQDIIRSNPVSVGYAFFKSVIDSSSTREHQRAHESGQYTRTIAVSNIGDPNPSPIFASR